MEGRRSTNSRSASATYEIGLADKRGVVMVHLSGILHGAIVWASRASNRDCLVAPRWTRSIFRLP